MYLKDTKDHLLRKISCFEQGPNKISRLAMEVTGINACLRVRWDDDRWCLWGRGIYGCGLDVLKCVARARAVSCL